MARPKKDGRRATGIQGKHGYLHIIISQPVIKDGVKKTEKKWISTGLKDIPENVKRASEMRTRLLNRKSTASIDRNITVADYLNLYLDRKKREVSDTTYAAYTYRAKHISDVLGPVRVKDLNELLVEKFLDACFEEHNSSPRSVKDIKVLFATIIDAAQKDDLIAYNPVKEVVINKTLAAQYAREKKEDEVFFSYEEAQRFLEAVKDHELYELFYLTLFFGLRRGEVLGLRWSAIDLKKCTMRIIHTVTKGTAINRKNATKNEHSTREYPLSPEQVDMFKRLKKRELESRKLCGNSYYDSDYIFKHSDGSLYYPDYPTKAFGKLIRKIPELPQEITFHGLRKSCVSILIRQGMDIKSIQKWVGHADINTTLGIYAKVKEKEAKMEISDAMTGIIPMKDYSNK